MPSFLMMPIWNEFGVGLANHIWQSTLFLLVVCGLTLPFRKNRAVVRYRLWLIASVKFLIPLSLLVGIGGFLKWTPVQQFTRSEVPIAIRQVSQPFSAAPAMVPPVPAAAVLPAPKYSLAPLVAFVWFVGAASVLLMWCARWLQIARVVRRANPVEASLSWIKMFGKSPRVRVLASPAGMEPGVFGIFRPVLLIPEDIAQHLDEAQLKAIVAHEMAHVLGRDNLAAAVHTIVQALFWFHPLVWWLGNKLVDERERACDEAVLQLGYEPADYAEGILKVCKRYVVAPACVAGVSGSNLKKRIEAIMENRATQRVTLGKKLMLILAGAVILAGPLLGGMRGVPKPSEIPFVSVLTSPVPVYETALKVAVTTARRSQAAASPVIQVGSKQPYQGLRESEAPYSSQRGGPSAIGGSFIGLNYSTNNFLGYVETILTVPPSAQSANGQPGSIDEVSIIITDAEKKAYQQLTKDEERENFIRNFWLARDPTPGTPANEFRDEYSRRLVYVNQHFTTQSGIPGSQTDRGKMYIINGPPDAIHSEPTGTTVNSTVGGVIRSAPFETWHYRHLDGRGDNIVYEFVDKQMNGEYTLEYDPIGEIEVRGATIKAGAAGEEHRSNIAPPDTHVPL